MLVIYARSKQESMNLTRFLFIRDGASGELKFSLKGHAMGVISIDVSQDGSRKF
jgi:hypothetical protein